MPERVGSQVLRCGKRRTFLYFDCLPACQHNAHFNFFSLTSNGSDFDLLISAPFMALSNFFLDRANSEWDFFPLSMSGVFWGSFNWSWCSSHLATRVEKSSGRNLHNVSWEWLLLRVGNARSKDSGNYKKARSWGQLLNFSIIFQSHQFLDFFGDLEPLKVLTPGELPRD